MDDSPVILCMSGDRFIDRRLAGKNKSIGNRERFVRRSNEQVREAVKRAVGERDISDIGDGGVDVHIPKRDLTEPVFGHGQGGANKRVHPGNDEYVAGDLIERPKGGGGSGSGKGQASDSGEGEDDFIFHLSKEEFMRVFFDDLALPDLMQTTLLETPEYKIVRAGLTTEGTATNLHLVRSMRGALGRAVAFGKSKYRKELEEVLDELDELESLCHLCPLGYDELHAALMARVEELGRKIGNIAFLDPIDLRYRSRMKVPVPTAKAVMFLLMDVSGSMDEERKDLSKRFFILLYLFLTRHYERIDLVFIRHHTQAQEVNEHDFFHAKETGGTVVSSALVLMEEIIKERYADQSEWNVYGAQASDGDNWHHDSGRCKEMLKDSILPRCRYYAYIQVVKEEQQLWKEYMEVAATCKNFAMKYVEDKTQIYGVFRDLFKRKA